ncbi:hypothetical protein [Pseudobacteriovorax antillogorgiicola]|uniref:Uncharacterized protein n=1 Tax=Pseudobacteriovorax antillogorgiicola TaxID=1513793 RepID=A0A1Y6BY64_9BACT|nr:hypothetical protein [Pseudobacteriovorax antillogorgiicola]TCS53000.1 hypothetical protein EDD56_10851 [Pseudobacteriovorax antillogorgiicola]SMF27126.1 hypothetical protein SAMN06296036_108196 [Pseudobacteriovorax antillogorgiicola]
MKLFPWIIIASLAGISCTKERPTNVVVPSDIAGLEDDESYGVYTFEVVGGDDFRPPYLECVEDVLFGSDIKDHWDDKDYKVGKCPTDITQVDKAEYRYVGFCERLKSHIYRASEDAVESITVASLKRSCGAS